LEMVTYLAEVKFHPRNQTSSYTFQLTNINMQNIPFLLSAI